MNILGIDIGGTGIKGAIVDVETGELLTERIKILTPQPASPTAISEVVNQIVDKFDYRGVMGVGFPAIIRQGVAMSASNIDKQWINTNCEILFTNTSGNQTFVANDADVAGLAEFKYGIGRDTKGTVIFLTIGTGIGSAVFYDGIMIPNTEFGHLIFKNNEIAEKYCSNVARKKHNLSWKEFGKRLNEYLNYLDKLFSPHLMIIGGGIVNSFDEFKSELNIGTKVIPATLENAAGVIGAAMYAKSCLKGN